MEEQLDDLEKGQERVRQLLEKIDQAIDRVNDDMSAVLGWLPRSIADPLRTLFQRIVDGVRGLVTWIRRILAYCGSSRLKSVASVWQLGVGKPLNQLSQDVAQNMGEIENYWTGLGADAYKAAGNMQVATLASYLTDVANPIAKALVNVWDTLVTLCIAVEVGLLMILAGLIGLLYTWGASGGLIASGMAAIILAFGAALTAMSFWASELQGVYAGLKSWPSFALPTKR